MSNIYNKLKELVNHPSNLTLAGTQRVEGYIVDVQTDYILFEANSKYNLPLFIPKTSIQDIRIKKRSIPLQSSTIAPVDYSHFQNLLTSLKQKWLQIINADQVELDGILASVQEEYILIIKNDEIIIMPLQSIVAVQGLINVQENFAVNQIDTIGEEEAVEIPLEEEYSDAQPRIEDKFSFELEVITGKVTEHTKEEEVKAEAVSVDTVQVDIMEEEAAEITEIAVDQNLAEVILVEDFTEEVQALEKEPASDEMNELIVDHSEVEELIVEDVVEATPIHTENKLASESKENIEIEIGQNEPVEMSMEDEMIDAVPSLVEAKEGSDSKEKYEIETVDQNEAEELIVEDVVEEPRTRAEDKLEADFEETSRIEVSLVEDETDEIRSEEASALTLQSRESLVITDSELERGLTSDENNYDIENRDVIPSDDSEWPKYDYFTEYYYHEKKELENSTNENSKQLIKVYKQQTKDNDVRTCLLYIVQ